MTLQASDSRFVRILLLACFLSGAASLFFEVLWTRAFSLILSVRTGAWSGGPPLHTPARGPAPAQAPLSHQPRESYLFTIALGSGAAVLSLELV